MKIKEVKQRERERKTDRIGPVIRGLKFQFLGRLKQKDYKFKGAWAVG